MDEELKKKIKSIAYILEKLDDREKIEKIHAHLMGEYRKYSDEVKRFFEEDFDRFMAQDVFIDIGTDDDKVIDEVNKTLRDGITKKR